MDTKMTDEKIIAALINRGWSYNAEWPTASCRWCHRNIYFHEVLISPSGTVYHELCAIRRYQKIYGRQAI